MYSTTGSWTAQRIFAAVHLDIAGLLDLGSVSDQPWAATDADEMNRSLLPPPLIDTSGA